MAITLGMLCSNCDKQYDMHLLAGRSGLDKGVRWIHAVEDTEVPAFLHGNELIVTTGIGKHKPPGWLIDFARHLYENGAAGLIVNLGPYIESVPSDLIVFCEKNGFPLFSLPWKVHIIDMMYELCRRIISSEETELSLANAFRGLIFATSDKSEIEPILERRGFHRDSSYNVVTAEMYQNGVSVTAKIWKQLQFSAGRAIRASGGPLGVFVQENHLTFVCRQDSDTIMKTVGILCDGVRKLSDETELHVGISDLKHGLDSVPSGYHEALSSMKAANFQKQEIMNYRDLGVYKLLFGVDDIQILIDFEKSVLSPLTDSAQHSAAEDLKILRCYLECNCSVNETAGKLGVHRNTINYKMKLIREMLGVEFNEEDKVKIVLAMYIRNMLCKDQD